MHSTSTGVLLAALSLAAVTSESGAQQTSLTDPRAAALESLRISRPVRIHAGDIGLVQGRFLSLSRDSLFLATPAGDRALPVAALDSLWVRGTAAKTGAIVGAIPAGIAGMLLGAFFNALCTDPDGGGGGAPCLLWIPISAVAVGAIGAGVGALIGAAVPKWHRKLPPRRRAGAAP